eukprot:1068818-Pleurochrysis_carterae.AAC.2
MFVRARGCSCIRVASAGTFPKLPYRKRKAASAFARAVARACEAAPANLAAAFLVCARVAAVNGATTLRGDRERDGAHHVCMDACFQEVFK